MSYFPLMLEMQDLKVLIVGGGGIAQEKLEKVLDFTHAITVLSIEVSDTMHHLISSHALTLQQRAYCEGDALGYDMVIVATETREIHASIYRETRRSRTLVNSVDDTAYCDFIFPSYIQRDDLTIAFSTGGSSPAFAKQLRQYFEMIIPHSVGGFLKKMKHLRTTLPKGKARMEHFDTLVRAYFKKNFK